VRIELADAVRDGFAGVTITVRDFGAGIAAKDLGQVFEPFFTTGRCEGGTGLGLSIVRNLVVGLLGGAVSIESQPGDGTAVELWIPNLPGAA
jgi:signal transduction histidine kinase